MLSGGFRRSGGINASIANRLSGRKPWTDESIAQAMKISRGTGYRGGGCCGGPKHSGPRVPALRRAWGFADG